MGRRLAIPILLLLAAAASAQDRPVAPDPAAKPVAAWVEELHAAEAPVRRRAAYALWSRWSDLREAVPALADALTDPDPYVSDVAGRTLRRIGSWAGVAMDAVAAALADERVSVRRHAIEILVNCTSGAAPVAPQVVEALADEDAQVRTRAALSLAYGAGPLGGSAFAPQVVAALCDALSDPEPAVRAQAATALGAFGPVAAGAGDSLVRMQEDADAGVRAAALRALGATRVEGDPSRAALAFADRALRLDADPRVREAAFEALRSLDPRDEALAPAAVRALREEERGEFRRAAIQVLAERLFRPERVEAVRRALADPDPLVRSTAAGALPRAVPTPARVVEDLAPLLRDPQSVVRAAAAQALGAMGPRSAPAVPCLVELLAAPSAVERGAGIVALGKIGPAAREAIPALRRRAANDGFDSNRELAGTAVLAIEGGDGGP